MKKTAILLFSLAICLVLAGCDSLLSGSYISVNPYTPEAPNQQSSVITASSYTHLYHALKSFGENGTEQAVIVIQEYDDNRLDSDFQRAVESLRKTSPIFSYAVNTVEYELGTSGGARAMALTFTYIHNRTEIMKIQRVATMDNGMELIYGALDSCGPGLVMLVDSFEDLDFQQLAADYAEKYPEIVMEVPQLAVNVFPENGVRRVVEINFLYQHSRESLRAMQNVVQPVFYAAGLSVIEDADTLVKYSQLFSFLMERYDYKIETSLTPAYSLLRHGVGDLKAFATVYAGMCRKAELACQVVTGTRDGKSWCWNIIRVEDMYYHVDLTRSSAEGQLRLMTDAQMNGYVWDYSAHPPCGVPVAAEENTQ